MYQLTLAQNKKENLTFICYIKLEAYCKKKLIMAVLNSHKQCSNIVYVSITLFDFIKKCLFISSSVVSQITIPFKKKYMNVNNSQYTIYIYERDCITLL